MEDQQNQPAAIDWATIAAQVADIAGAPPSGTSSSPPADAAPPAEVATEAQAPQEAPAAQAPEGSPFTAAQLAQLIREEREAKELKAKYDAELKGLEPIKGEYEKLKAKLQDVHGRFIDDPAGFLEEAGVPREKWLEIAEYIFFSTDPSKASPELHQRIETKKRDRALEKRAADLERRQREWEERQAREQAEAPVRAYQATLQSHAGTLTAQSHPAIAAWFEGDAAALAQTMFNTAQNLAAAASAKGERADLSPQRVAQEVEAYLDAKFSRRLPPPQAKAQPSAVVTSPAGTVKTTTPPPAQTNDDNSVEAREARAARMLDELFRGR